MYASVHLQYEHLSLPSFQYDEILFYKRSFFDDLVVLVDLLLDLFLGVREVLWEKLAVILLEFAAPTVHSNVITGADGVFLEC